MIKRVTLITAMHLALLLTAFPSQAGGETTITIRVDAGERLQRIDGFGSGAFGGFTIFERGHCDAPYAKGVTYKTTPEQRRQMVSTAVRELGVTHLRMWLCPAGIEPVNDNDDPHTLDWDAFKWEGRSDQPISDKQRENRAYGLREWTDFLVPAVEQGCVNWIVTPGWAPDWLKSRMDDPDDPQRFDEYAEWAVAHLLFLKKEFGLEAPYWSMFNEPDNLGWTSPGMWIEWIRTTGRRFRKEGLTTKIMAPDFMNVYAAVPLTEKILADDECRSYIGAIAYHHYRSCFDDPKPFLDITSQPETCDQGELYERLTGGARAMAALGRRYNLVSWQTETAYYPKPIKNKKLTPWDVAMGRANEIHYELASGASAVAGMLTIAIDAIDPRYSFTVRMAGHHIVLTTTGVDVDQWWVTKDAGAMFGHYGRYVRPGDRRIASASSHPQVRSTAFLARSDTRCVVVLVNNLPNRRVVQIKMNKLPFEPTFAGGLLTDEIGAMRETPVREIGERGYAYEITMPPRSVATVVIAANADVPLELPAHVRFR